MDTKAEQFRALAVGWGGRQIDFFELEAVPMAQEIGLFELCM